MIAAPQVTVVTICRNAARHIEATLQSIIGQTVRDRIQYIVVDGASTDGTLDVLARYAGHIDVLISEPDRGISDAFNKGVRASTGQWINFMNGGDRFARSEAVARVLDRAQPDHDVVFGRCILETPAGEALGIAGKQVLGARLPGQNDLAAPSRLSQSVPI